MRNLTFILAFLLAGWSVSASTPTSVRHGYTDSFIFVENGVEFAVFPNGEFDFYYNPDFRRNNIVNISTPGMNISYNSGYNYDPYIQYDDYGAVIQIESVPIYYDYYGRIVQAGDVFIQYNSFGQIARIGNLFVHYNHFHRFTSYSGYINRYNRHYVYRPWHQYYTRPSVNVSVVFNQPYRAYYEPHRISYNTYVNYYHSHPTYYKKRSFYRPDQRIVSYNNGQRLSHKREIQKVDSHRNSGRDYARRSSENSRMADTRHSSTRPQTDYHRSKTISSRTERNTNAGGSAVRKPQVSDHSRTRTSSDANTRTRRSSSILTSKAPSRNESTRRTTSSTHRSISRPSSTTREQSRTSSHSPGRSIKPQADRSHNTRTRSSSSGRRSVSTPHVSRSHDSRSNSSRSGRSSARNMQDIK